MAVNVLLVRAYALNVYRTGANSLSNIALTRPDYIIPVMQRAADFYEIDYIDQALTNSWITAQEHADTLALKGPEDQQHLPELLRVAETELTV